LKSEVRVYRINTGWVTLEVALASLPNPIDAGVIAEISKKLGGSVIGLPWDNVSPCSLALAYLYTLEDIELGSRVKSKPILLLMNLLGLSQVRDVVETVRECKAIAAVGNMGEAQVAVVEALRELDIKEPSTVDVGGIECTAEELEKVTLPRVERL